MSEIKEEYKGYTIYYSEDANTWIVRDADGEEVGRGSASLVLARAAVDRALKGSSTFKPIPIIGYLNSWNALPKVREGKITSFREGHRGSITARVSWKDGKRETESVGAFLFADTPENRERLQKYVDLLVEANARRETASKYSDEIGEFKLQFPTVIELRKETEGV